MLAHHSNSNSYNNHGHQHHHASNGHRHHGGHNRHNQSPPPQDTLTFIDTKGNTQTISLHYNPAEMNIIQCCDPWNERIYYLPLHMLDRTSGLETHINNRVGRRAQICMKNQLQKCNMREKCLQIHGDMNMVEQLRQLYIADKKSYVSEVLVLDPTDDCGDIVVFRYSEIEPGVAKESYRKNCSRSDMNGKQYVLCEAFLNRGMCMHGSQCMNIHVKKERYVKAKGQVNSKRVQHSGNHHHHQGGHHHNAAAQRAANFQVDPNAMEWTGGAGNDAGMMGGYHNYGGYSHQNNKTAQQLYRLQALQMQQQQHDMAEQLAWSERMQLQSSFDMNSLVAMNSGLSSQSSAMRTDSSQLMMNYQGMVSGVCARSKSEDGSDTNSSQGASSWHFSNESVNENAYVQHADVANLGIFAQELLDMQGSMQQPQAPTTAPEVKAPESELPSTLLSFPSTAPGVDEKAADFEELDIKRLLDDLKLDFE